MSGFSVDHRVGSGLSASFGDVELLSYTYAPDTVELESPKPFLHPLRTLSGDVVSLFRPHDHVWHKGIAWSLPHVGGENFWGGPTYVHGQSYVQLENNGRAEHRRLTRLDVSGDGVHIAHDLDWLTQGGSHVFTEQRALTVQLAEENEAWTLVFETAMTNVSGSAISIGSPTTKGRENAGYGGLFWRGPRSFTGGVIHAPGGSGGEELRGTREEWMGFSGQHDENARWSTVVMVDDRENPRHPPQWFTRTEQFACLCPAPFFSEELSVADGETLRLRYAVVIADGNEHHEQVGRLAEWGRQALAAAITPAGSAHDRVIA